MKKLILILLLVAYWLPGDLYPQDTSIIKYLPLNVENTWVYNWTTVVPPTTGKVKIKITGTVASNGHIFYVFQQTGSTCACGLPSYSPFLVNLAPIRIDSVSGNIMSSGGVCQWQGNEFLLDSLKKRIGDSAIYPCNITICIDTNNMSVFGITRKTKWFTDNIMTYYSSRRYVKDIGLFYSNKGCQFGYTCIYNLQGCVINGVLYGDTAFPLGINKISSEIPEKFSLSQNYPNPFNPVTLIKFEIPNSKFEIVKLNVYDVLGCEVQTLVNEQLSPGTYKVEFDGNNLSSGIYYYTLTAGNYNSTKKMVLIR